MAEDWLAAWDSATEDERRLVLATVAERIEKSRSRLELVVAPRTFVIAARRARDLVVVTCSYWRDCIRDANRGIPVSETDYHYVHVEIDELVVDSGRVERQQTLISRESFYVDDIGIDDEGEARAIADEFLRGRHG